VIFAEFISGDTVHEATLADARVADYDQLEEIILGKGGCSLVGGGEDLEGDRGELGGLEVGGGYWGVVCILDSRSAY